MNNIDGKQNKTKSCTDCLKVFELPANGLYKDGKFRCMDCLCYQHTQRKLNNE